jgi:Rho-binding antiterminator
MLPAITHILSISAALMSPDYTPIDCHFYDLLEAAATQRRRVALQYFNDLRQLCLGSGVIDTLFIRDKVEFMRTHRRPSC